MTAGANPTQRLFGGIEIGGTKVIAMVAAGPDAVVAETRIPSTTPTETLHGAVGFLVEHHRRAPIAALGIASFGPLDLDAGSASFGCITSTPKRGWAGTDLIGSFRSAL